MFFDDLEIEEEIKKPEKKEVQGKFNFDNDQLVYPERRSFFKGEFLCYPLINIEIAGYVIKAIERTTELIVLKDIVVLSYADNAYLVLQTKKAETYPEMFSLVNSYLFEYQLNNI
ncbi:MAG TPA: hypothetical protein P5136_01080 [Methanofastidiosum sp.]|nr:hypothetical protein [Methanofastidiosum sp.]